MALNLLEANLLAGSHGCPWATGLTRMQNPSLAERSFTGTIE